MESKAAAAATFKVVNLPTNEMAYSNLAYVNPECPLVTTATHVMVNQRCVFGLAPATGVELGGMALSSLQRDGFGGAVKLWDTISVKPFNPQDAPNAVGVTVVYEPVANFKIQVVLHLLQKFLVKQFNGQIVKAGQWLASNQFEKRVFKFEIKQVKTLDNSVSFGRITPETIFICECSPRALAVVEQNPPLPRPPALETKDPVPLADLEALITAYHRVENIKSGGPVELVRPYSQVLEILASRIETTWEHEVGTQKRARIEHVPGTVQE